MDSYKHVVQYYETDKMGITHHSNYVRWMEEARVDYLKNIGWDYAKLESLGIVSPVVEVQCRYLKTTTFADEISITVGVKEYKGVKLMLHYVMKNQQGETVCESDSMHCFLDEAGRPIRMAKQFPEFDKALKDAVM